MQLNSAAPESQDGFGEGLKRALDGVQKADSLSQACQQIAEYWHSLDVELLSVKFCDVNDRTNILRPFSAYHEGMQVFRTGPGYPDGCPFSREAMKRLRPFSLNCIDRAYYPELVDRRFFRELEKTGHQNIAVVPIMIGSGMCLKTLGLSDNGFSGQMRHLIGDASAHFVAAIVARFPEVGRLFEKKVLSQVQQQVVQLACEGFDDEQIAPQIGVSAVTVRLMFDAAAKRLGTTSRAATAYRAVCLGEISSGLALTSTALPTKGGTQ